MTRDIQPTQAHESQHELLSLRRGLSSLSKQHKTVTLKVETLREERSALRQKLTTSEKQLSLMKRRVSALSSERDQLERERETEQVHLHKLESKLNAMADTGQVYDKMTNLRRKLRREREENAALKAKLQSTAEENRNQDSEIQTLQTALRLKTEEIVEETGKDIPTRLLYAVARSREDGVLLAIQLTDERERSRSLAQSLSSEKESLEAERRKTESLEDQLSHKERRIVSLEAAAKSLQSNFDKLQEQFDQSREECEMKSKEITLLKETIDECRHLESQLRGQMREEELKAVQREKDLRSELVGAVERESSRSQEEKKTFLEEKTSLERQLHSAQSDLMESEYNLNQSRLAVERQQIALSEAEERIQNIVLHTDSKEQQLKEDMKALDGHVTALNEKCSSLSDELSTSRSEVSFQMSKVAESAKRAQNAEKMLSQEEERWQSERGKMVSKLEDTLVQLSGAIEKADRLERESAGLRAESQIKENRIQQLMAEMTNIRESNNALYKSKELLQRAMLEQVSDVRNRLDQAGYQNKELEANLYKQRETERVLKDIIRSSPLAPSHSQHNTHLAGGGLAFPSPVQPQGLSAMSRDVPNPTPAATAAARVDMMPSSANEAQRNLASDSAAALGGGTNDNLNFPSLEQLAGIDKDVISKLLTPQSAMRLRSL